jgi:hypothetical protein
MEQPTVPVVDLAPGGARRHCRATHDSFHFKNQQSSLDNHQSIPRDARGLEKTAGTDPHLAISLCVLCAFAVRLRNPGSDQVSLSANISVHQRFKSRTADGPLMDR